ncbi:MULTISPECIES: glycosyltransferase family 1 protein [unclassified Pseudomonas]|uniref:glycosyltransferase family 4 protein n=1 Tax=unclassified Pseudomonas TaxID=196821 RepID=UPI002448C8C6|nr:MULTISPECIES: glycosyltransferase family 1 protein [unclassified Pseudomonas]MDG9924028.1 glycosyltransferase family 4 protein [Pseudomonas sp. GD04045]MDH0034985.1 glycosyltransferase family 4 protein [Pseudomonas sp. GD04019]
MRVGLDYRPATVAPQSGIGRQVCALEQALLARGATTLVRFSEAPLEHAQRQIACCPEWASPLGGLQRPQVRLRFEAGFLPRALREQRIDLYIATANMGLPLGRKARNQRQVLLLHDLFQLTEHNHHRSRLKALAYRLIDGLSIAWSVWRADRVWCPSQFSAEETKRLFPFARNKVRVLPNLVEPCTSERAPRPDSLPARYWLAVGTREPRKNMAHFVSVWQASRETSSEVPELVLVGHCEDLPETLRALPGLHWRSGMSDADLQALYQHAECLWQPSYAEGFGLPVVEALGHGTPVALACGSALDEVAPAQSPRFAPHDAGDLRRCLLELAQRPLPRDDSLREWAARYAPAAYRARLNDLLQELGA